MKEETLNIQEFLARDERKDMLRFLTAGSVDDGKSTLIGRLMFDSKRLYEDHLSALIKDSKRVGHAGDDIDYALLLDGLKAEREQGITIDVAYRYFSTNKRKFIIADTPGHEQYTRNMVTGASTANLAIILTDATKGVITQTKRHTFLVSLLGIKHIVLAVNKMDLVDYDQARFDKICDDYKKFLTQLNVPDVECIPISALKGDNVVDVSENMKWYHGKSMMEYLETVHVSSDNNFEDLRFPVQYVLRPDRAFRGFSGRVASGVIKENDEVMVLPSMKKSKVKSIITYDGRKKEAFPPQSVTVTLKDEIDISRGEMIIHPENAPKVDRHFETMLVWMDENKMDISKTFYIKHNTNTTRARIDDIEYRIDVNTLKREKKKTFELNDIGRVVITTNKPLFFDPYRRNRNTGSFILVDPITHNTCAVGMILDKRSSDKLPSRITDIDKDKIRKGESLISEEERTQRNGHKGSTVWITGLHGSGKNDLAYTLEKNLFDQGANVILLDGSTVRTGLSKELDFSRVDRAEHLRRVAHIARILNDQGIIVICSFISPDETIRNQISEIIGKHRFVLIYMSTKLEDCKNYRPDLYKLAENGAVSHIPGLDDNYDEPDSPDITINIDNYKDNIDSVFQLLHSKSIFKQI